VITGKFRRGGNVSDACRTVGIPGTGKTTTLPRRPKIVAARVVAVITLAPGGAVTPRAHRARKTIECVEGALT
jgi:hypothetical protein